jgi:hypothetical protein
MTAVSINADRCKAVNPHSAQMMVALLLGGPVLLVRLLPDWKILG